MAKMSEARLALLAEAEELILSRPEGIKRAYVYVNLERRGVDMSPINSHPDQLTPLLRCSKKIEVFGTKGNYLWVKKGTIPMHKNFITPSSFIWGSGVGYERQTDLCKWYGSLTAEQQLMVDDLSTRRSFEQCFGSTPQVEGDK